MNTAPVCWQKTGAVFYCAQTQREVLRIDDCGRIGSHATTKKKRNAKS
ncbi:MAG: hypothetical protein ACYC2W_03855 [Desulfurivibrionaceae bacterium]